ncbi:MAG TPA: DUF445 domain-containing protein [Gemmatimonadales bacterium]
MTDHRETQPRLAGQAPVRAPEAPLPRVTVPASTWTRPDDGERQARLDAMKRRATALLGVAGAVFVAASLFERRYPWLGFVRATAEASLVGGLADWFAVTALFRHPLGLPIPHTAIIANGKERIGRILGNFVQNHFLSHEVIAANLRRVRPAARAATWLSHPSNSAKVARHVANGLAETIALLPDKELGDLVALTARQRLAEVKLAPALGNALTRVLAGTRRQELLNVAVKLAAQAVHENHELIRQRVRAESPWWVPGAVDDKIYQRIIAATEKLLNDIGADPAHPLRASFDDAFERFVAELQYSPEMIIKAESLKEEWLRDQAVTDLSGKLWQATKRSILDYIQRPDGALSIPLERGIGAFGAALLENDALLQELDDMAIDLVAAVVERYRGEIGDLIAQTVAGWDPDATSRRFELAVGRDLQFVRINGTLVGGLVGLLLYTIAWIWR